MTEQIAILVVGEDKQHHDDTVVLLQGCLLDPLRLFHSSNNQEALKAMAANQHDLYLVLCRINQAEQLSLIRQSRTKGCRRPIILLHHCEKPSVAGELAKLQAVTQLYVDELTPLILQEAIRTALDRNLTKDKNLTKPMDREIQTTLMDSYEQMQARLSHRLHEGPLQDLIGMRFYLGIASDVVESTEAKQQLAFVQQNLQGVIDSLRSFCVELRPPALVPFGLEKAMRAEIGRFRQRHPEINVAANLDSDELLLPERIRLVLYRIFQQAILNVAQHANASQLEINLELTNATVHLEVQDNGCGFILPDTWTAFASDGRFGLLDAQQRALNVGGQFQVASVLADNAAAAPSVASNSTSGTTLSVTVPIDMSTKLQPLA
jgi:two-component system sensor histidine kinase UhpB